MLLAVNSPSQQQARDFWLRSAVYRVSVRRSSVAQLLFSSQRVQVTEPSICGHMAERKAGDQVETANADVVYQRHGNRRKRNKTSNRARSSLSNGWWHEWMFEHCLVRL